MAALTSSHELAYHELRIQHACDHSKLPVLVDNICFHMVAVHSLLHAGNCSCSVSLVCAGALTRATLDVSLLSLDATHVQDLSGGNVMLTSCSINPHGFQAKVGDFGLSRDADASAKIAGNVYGTITHMAPEVMLEATLGPVRIATV